MNIANTIDSPERLQEMADEERSARFFGISIEQLRQQRREFGQLLTGPYAGCSPDFALMAEQSKYVSEVFRKLKEAVQRLDVHEVERQSDTLPETESVLIDGKFVAAKSKGETQGPCST